jgi:hypothetical protein
LLAKALFRLLPRLNNYCPIDYPELLQELRHFGIQNRWQLRRLVLKSVREAIQIDREPLDEVNARMYRKELGDEEFLFLERRRIFFGWEGLMRVILELGFGDQYREFAEKRDASDAPNGVQPNECFERTRSEQRAARTSR